MNKAHSSDSKPLPGGSWSLVDWVCTSSLVLPLLLLGSAAVLYIQLDDPLSGSSTRPLTLTPPPALQAVTALYTAMIFTHTVMSFPVLLACMVVSSALLSATLPIGESLAQAVLGEGSPVYGYGLLS